MSQRKMFDLGDYVDSKAAPAARTAAMAKCLSDCAAAAGELRVPSGDWDVGAARVPGGIRILLDAGANLIGDLAIEDAHDLGILGESADRCTVERIRARRSGGLSLEGFGGRVLSFERCDGGTIRGLSLHQRFQRQGEGSVIWMRWCANLDFADCDLSCNDDVFCIKNTGRNISLRRSVLRGQLAAPFKIGTESNGVVEHITFTDCVIHNSDRAAISLESVDGAHLRNVVIAGIRMINVSAPLFIRLGARDRYAEGIGSISDISISNIEAIGMDLDEGYGSSITGLSDHPICNVSLSDVRLTYRGGQGRELTARPVPERSELYPEYDMLGKLPAYGLYCRHVRGLALRRVAMQFASADERPALLCDDVDGLELDGFEPMAWPGARHSVRDVSGKTRYSYPDERPAGEPAIELRNVTRACIHDCRAPFGVPFLRLRGGRTDLVTLRGNELRWAAKPSVLAGEEVAGRLSIDPPVQPRRIARWEPTVEKPRRFPGPAKVWLARAGGDTRQIASLVEAVRQAREGDSVLVGPGEVRLQPGEYPLVIDKPRITLRSTEGADATRIVAEGASEKTLADAWDVADTAVLGKVSLIAITADGAHVEDLTLSAALYNIFISDASDCVIRGNHLDFSKRWHIYARNGRGHRIESNRSRAALNCILRMENCADCVVQGNISREDPSGYRLSGSCGNRFIANQFHAISWWAMMLEAASNANIIQGNEFLDGRMCGLQLRASADIQVLDNTFRGHKTEAILIDHAARGILIRGNGFEDNRGLAVSNETEFTVNARENWWGSAHGPGGAGPGTGDMVDRNVEFEPWLRQRTAPAR